MPKMDLSKLSPEEQAKLQELLDKADPPDPDPEEEKASIGPRIPDAEDWVAYYKERAVAARDHWKKKTLHPSADPIKEGASDDAEAAFKNKMEQVLKDKARQATLKKMKFEDFGRAVELTDPTDYSKAVERKVDKMQKGIDAQHALRLYAVTKLDAMPTATKEQRDKKLLAAKDTNIEIGRFLRGIISDADCKAAIDKLTASTPAR